MANFLIDKNKFILDFTKYQDEIEKITKLKDEQYSNIVNALEAFKGKKLNLLYLIFTQYKQWIFPYISFSPKCLYILDKIKQNKKITLDDKIFILWYLYLFSIFFDQKESTNNNNLLKYLFLETNKIVSILLESKILLINNSINILDIYLIALKNFVNSPNYHVLPSKVQKIAKLFLFQSFFDLFEKISIIIIKSNEYKDFELILKYFKKIIYNEEFNDEINIIMILKYNIIQNFMNNILVNINPIEIEKMLPKYKDELIKFYSHFILYRYKISNLFSNCLEISRKSFLHLYNINYNKNSIIKDIFINSFNSSLLNELTKIEKEKNKTKNIISSCFFFDHKNSVISLMHEKINLDKTILFFSFQIGKEQYHLNEKHELPLIIIYYYSKKEEVKLKIFLKKIEEKDSKLIKYHLYFSHSTNDTITLINSEEDKFFIDNKDIYYVAIAISEKKLKVFMFHDTYKKNENNAVSKEINIQKVKKDSKLKLVIGNNESNSFYNGKIGPIILVNSKDIKELDSFIIKTLNLKDKYKDFLILNTDLSKYNFNLVDYYEEKIIYENYEVSKDNKEEKKLKIECLLYLYPNYFNNFDNNIFNKECMAPNINNYFPIISNICKEKFLLLELNISVINYENIVKLFCIDNGLSYINLQIEFYNQFSQYYYLKNRNNYNIYNQEELKNIIKNIISNFKENIFLLECHNQSKRLYNHYKSIFATFFNCLLNLNKITPIINDIINDLLILKDIYRGIITTSQPIEQNESINNFINIQKNNILVSDFSDYKSYLQAITSYYIGIIEILLTTDFYNNSQKKNNIELIQKLFNNLLSTMITFDINKENEDFYNKIYEKIFYKIINFIPLLLNYFNKKDNNDNYIILDDTKPEEDIKDGKKTYIDLLELIFKLLINIFYEREEFIHQLFRFIFCNNKNNYYIIYSYLDSLYNYSMEKNILLFFDENEITHLKIVLSKLNENINIEVDLKEKIETLLIVILYDYTFSNPRKNKHINLNYIEEFLKNKDNPKYLLLKIKTIFERYLFNYIIKNNIKNSIIKDLSKQEIMQYTWEIFLFLIIILKAIKKNKIKYNETDFSNYIYTIIVFFPNIESHIQEDLDSNKINYFIIIYLINYIKFLNFVASDEDLNFLLNDTFFFKLIDNSFKSCLKSTLFHSNIYIVLNEKEEIDEKDKKDDLENKKEKKLVSQIFLEIYKTHLDKIYLKYNNEDKSEVSDDDLSFIENLNKIFETLFVQDIDPLNYNLKKNPNSSYELKNTIFFITEFLNILMSEKKYLKKFEKNKNISPLIHFYKETKEILLNIDKNNKESNNSFDFYFTTYYFYEILMLKNKLEGYIKNEKISKLSKLVRAFRNLQSQLLMLEIIILDDHLKINQIYKDYYLKKTQNNDFILKNLLKIIPNKIFDKKNKGKDLLVICQEIEKELSSLKEEIKENNDKESNVKEDKKETKIEDNLKKLDNSPHIEKKLIINNNKNEEKKIELINKEKEDNKEEIIINEKENNILNINYTETVTTNDLSAINTIVEKEIEKINEIVKENEGEKLDDKNCKEELPLLELPTNSYNIFDEIDKNYIINPKKELMKIIFGAYFEESFFNNEIFQKLKYIFLNYFKAQSETKLLNFPSKLKNFTNGLEIPLFLKENKKFFISKTFPITHKYFYRYMKEFNVKNESIILIKKDIELPQNFIKGNKEEKNVFDCELVKLDKVYYGQIFNSAENGFFIFKEKEYIIDENASNLKEEYEKKLFSLSALDIVSTVNAKITRKNATNFFKDDDVFPNDNINTKTLIIFYSEIEEVIERRFLLLWQGIEIFLKSGKSYIFNMMTFDNYNNFIKHFKNIKDVLYREKNFFTKSNKISEKWKNNIINTYDYILLMNKYGSRSLNDPNQYYIFPWILINFNNILIVNEKESELYEYFQKNKEEKDDIEKKEELPINFEKIEEENNNIDNKSDIKGIINIKDKNKKEDEDNNDLSKYSKDFRKLKFPVSVQNPLNRENKIAKFNDYDEKFPHHHGTHYSTSSYLFYYLMRLEPFTTLLVELQNYCQESPDRMMQDLKDTIKIINSGNDNRELIPEFYSKIDFFINVNCVYFGRKKNKQIVDDLNKMFENNNIDENYNIISIYVKFIIEHQKLLNSKTIAININSWIDNIFGVGQLPKKKRESSFNVFGKTSYEEETNLHKKLDRLFDKGYDCTKIKKKLANKINLIISFGQTPQQIIQEKHLERNINIKEKNSTAEEEDPNNYGLQEDYLGDDFVSNFIINHSKCDNIEKSVKISGIFFDINPSIGKIFIISESCEIAIFNSNFYDYIEANYYNLIEIGNFQMPYICFFDKLKNGNNNYYIYNIKYSFSSFPTEINDTDNPNTYLYSSQYIKDIMKNDEKNNDIYLNDIKHDFKFITCRHLDNSFKIHNIIKNKELETYSYICEDFVMSCKAVSSNSFIIGLKNGKLIKALIFENKPQKNAKKKGKKEINDKYKIIFDKYIQGHQSSINMIELDQKRGVIITSADDNKLYIRKLYDFEILTSIKIKPKFNISLAKISPKNFLYIMCYNRIKQQFIIYGYTLSGLKFAKSSYSYYITNFDFTRLGNIICMKDEKDICILSAHNLNQISIDSNDEDFNKYNNVQNSISNVKWMQYDDFENYEEERKTISCLSYDSNSNCYLKTLKATNISYFK